MKIRATFDNSFRFGSTFKRLPIGHRFISSHDAKTYRKIGHKYAFPLDHEGRGLTHKKIYFTRSHGVWSQVDITKQEEQREYQSGLITPNNLTVNAT